MGNLSNYHAFKLARFLPFTLSCFLALSLALAGCGGGGGGSSGSTQPPSTPSVTITWNSPTTNTDTTPLTAPNDLVGYRIYYGTSSGQYTRAIDLGCDPCPTSCTSPSTSTECSFALTGNANFTTGTTYYIVITAYNSLGNDSDYSTEVPKTP
ncbi:MAG: fibronectin type III domain-containing protein [Nitrospirae bacterium]|nr:fibronectin type III domain-containing protein [Nitrospirota bacterium]